MPIKKLLVVVLSFTALSLFVSVAFGPKVSAAPATFTVTNINDSGAGSLQQAISDANSNGNPSDQDIIEFDIPGSVVHTITPSSDLTITQSVLIDGYTQDGTSENTTAMPAALDSVLRIAIENTNDGLGNIGFTVQADNVTLKGLAMYGTSVGRTNIEVVNADNFKLVGSVVGLAESGLDATQSSRGMSILGSSNVQIGGSLPKERNVFGRCANCILAEEYNGQNSTGLVIQGNNFGVGADSITYQGGSDIIILNPGTDSAQIGGAGAGEGNLIAHNTGSSAALKATDIDDLSVLGNRVVNNRGDNNAIELRGVVNSRIGSSGGGRNIIAGTTGSGGRAIDIIEDPNYQETRNLIIENNHIGVLNDGSTAYGNGPIYISGGQYIQVKENIIANSRGAGIYVTGVANNVSMLSNSIYDNTSLGIQTGEDSSPLQNDTEDPDTGPNDLLNYPVYYDVEESDDSTTISYYLDAPAGDYRIEFFSNTDPDSSNYGEGENFIGFDNFTSTGNGPEIASVTLDDTGHVNIAATATEIDQDSPNGYGATSEFGPAELGEDPIEPEPTFPDVALTKTLDNPEDIAPGATIDYTLTYTNDGTDSVDIAQFDGSIMGQTNLFLDFLPADITAFIGNANDDIDCQWLGANSAGMFGPALANHSDHSVLLCSVVADELILDPGESIDTTISVQLSENPSVSFTNYAIAIPPTGDPDSEAFNSPFSLEGYCYQNSLTDMIDCYKYTRSQTDFNNFAVGSTPVNLSIEKILLDPQDVSPGETISYQVALTNSGDVDVNLGEYGSFQNALFADIYPAADLDFIGDSTSGVACNELGPASLVGPAASDHPDHRYIGCVSQQPRILEPGETFNTVLNFEVLNEVSSQFTNYALHAPQNSSDPDIIDLGNAFANTSSDILDSYQNSNLTKTTFAADESSNIDTDSDGISDVVESTGPNNGDANNDNTPDAEQAHVASFVSSVTDQPVVLVISPTCAIIVTAQSAEQANAKQDSTYDYPLGLMSFTLDCTTPGYVATITQYYFNEQNAGYKLRKYFPVNGAYSTVDTASIASHTVASLPVVVASYQITDGGQLDLDGTPDGMIVDPAGLATTQSSQVGILSSTGQAVVAIAILGLLLLGGSVSLFHYAKRVGNKAKKV